MSGYSDFWNFSSFGKFSIFTWVKKDTASAACLALVDMNFAAVICDADDPCSVNTA